MAHSLEVREPLMDHPLVEWLASLPSSLKVRGQEGKYLLKKSMEPYLPREIMYRPKHGLRRAPGAVVSRAAQTRECANRCSAPDCLAPAGSTSPICGIWSMRTNQAHAITALHCGRC